MDDLLKNNFKEQYYNLPVELQKAIASSDLPNKLEDISRRNKLMIDQAGNLETETLIILLGLEPLKDYEDNLVKNVGLNRSLAITVAHDVDELIFKNIRETLKTINFEEGTPLPSTNEPSKEQILSEIENPSSIKGDSVSISSLGSNSNTTEQNTQKIGQTIEVRRDNLPETLPESAIVRRAEAFVQPKIIPSVPSIVETKTTQTVIMPKQQIVISEKSKLPEKSVSGDPYREAI
jgi:hypothetical protein